jgi:hypothetical protein
MRENFGKSMSLFRRFDANGDGQLTVDEFMTGCQSLDLPCTREEIEV